ncbi:MAG: hypothetical protein ABI592_15290 [Acidobacteriota bacterium]
MKKAPLHLALLAGAGLFVAVSMTAQPIGVIDEPAPGQHVSGVVRVAGFVLDFNAVDKIELFLDGNSLPTNRADLNIPRIDVLNAFPNYANSATPHPGYLTSFYTRSLTNGPHSVAVVVTESNGSQFTLGPISVIVDNSVNQSPFGYIDQPTDLATEGANGSYPIVGWALDDTGIDHIDFLVDSQIVASAIGRLDDGDVRPQTAVYGTTRPDVAAAFPDVPFSLFSGFVANVDTTKLSNGVHIFSVRVTDESAASHLIGTRTVQVINNGSNLAPFGRIDFPLDKASFNCQPPIPQIPTDVCPSPCFPPGPPGNPAVPVSFYSNIVRGWVLDTGSRLDKGQVAYVELMLDGVPIINTRNDCVQLGTALLNCYGVNRTDVARAYSGYVNADNAGFVFAFALEQNASGSFSVTIPFSGGGRQAVGATNSGKHTLAIRVGDDEATVIQIGAMSVDVLCDLSTTNPDHPAFGYIDQPSEYQFINQTFDVAGWAWDFDNGITSLVVDVDGQTVATLDAPSGTYGIERPDVPANDIRVPTRFVGFSYPLDTTRMTDTEHDLVIYSFDFFGRRSEIGRRKFVVLNNSPIKN